MVNSIVTLVHSLEDIQIIVNLGRTQAEIGIVEGSKHSLKIPWRLEFTG